MSLKLIGLHGPWCVITSSEFPHHVAQLAQKCDSGAMSPGYQQLARESCACRKNDVPLRNSLHRLCQSIHQIQIQIVNIDMKKATMIINKRTYV
jgi:hypothetical protein